MSIAFLGKELIPILGEPETLLTIAAEIPAQLLTFLSQLSDYFTVRAAILLVRDAFRRLILVDDKRSFAINGIAEYCGRGYFPVHHDYLILLLAGYHFIILSTILKFKPRLRFVLIISQFLNLEFAS